MTTDTPVRQNATRPDPPTRNGSVMVPIRAFRTPVRGHAFAAPPPGGTRPTEGLPAELAREPDNPADPLAVAVWASTTDGTRWRIGYLDRGVAARVAPRLDAGSRVRARLDGWSAEPDGRWQRPLLLLLPDDPAPPATSASGTDAEQIVTHRTATTGSPRIWGRPPGVRRRRVC